MSILPFVSIIIPNYNHSRFLADAIQSALEQSYPQKEIIIVDDGSTDNCREVVARYGDRVRYIWQENQGLAGARNTGIRASKGELIGLLDADDQWEPEYLEEMVALANQNPAAAVFYCQTRCVDIEGNTLPQVLGGPPVRPSDIYWVLIRSNFIIPSTVLLCKSIVLEAGLFDQNLRSCEDWDLWLRLLPEIEIVGSPKILVRYRIHDSSLSTNVEGMHLAARSVIQKHFGEDDSQYDLWPVEKRRAYGGLYWYQAWTSLTRMRTWDLAAQYVYQSIIADPTLVTNLDFFYELALGDQPSGYRGSSHALDLETNVCRLDQIFSNVAKHPSLVAKKQFRSELFSTAYFAFGILAYNAGQFQRCRLYLFKAQQYRKSLITNKRFFGLYIKSFLGGRLLNQIRNLRREKKVTT